MKPRFQVTARSWATLGTSAIVAGALLALPRVKPLGQPEAGELSSLRHERTQFAGSSDEALADLKREVARQDGQAWDEATFGAWVVAQDPAWGVESQRTGCALLVRMSRTDARMSGWPGIRSAIRQWADATAISVEGLEIEVTGRGSARVFRRVVVELRIPLAAPAGNPQRAGPGPGALPVAAAGSGTSREAGAGPSPRSSRPGHPGPSARTVSPTNPTKHP